MPTEYKAIGVKRRMFFAWKIDRGDFDSWGVTLNVKNTPEDDAPFVAKIVY
jgi:hypothetical protein